MCFRSGAGTAAGQGGATCVEQHDQNGQERCDSALFTSGFSNPARAP